MLASAGFSDELAASLVALMWQNSIDILDREDDGEINLDHFKSLPFYSQITFVPELGKRFFSERISALASKNACQISFSYFLEHLESMGPGVAVPPKRQALFVLM